MTTRGGNRVVKSGPLTQQQLRDLIEKSGYPLELRLFHSFKSARMDPVLGARIVADEDHSIEVDVLASLGCTKKLAEDAIGSVRLTAIMDAKLLHPPKVIVGFLGDRPSDRELNLLRARCAGTPEFVDGRVPPFIDAPGGLAEALSGLNAGPVCVHWAEVEGAKLARGDRMANSIGALVHVRRVLHQQCCSLHAAESVPHIRVHCPTIVAASADEESAPL